MKAYIAIIVGFISLLAPLWTLSGFVTVPQYRTGTIADFATALIAGATLYGGVFAGVLFSQRYRSRRDAPAPFRTIFVAGMVGAMAAITLALMASALSQLISTGRVIPAGQTPALLPVFYIVGGILSLFIAAGIGLVSYGLRAAKR
jgi:hypothetical protein